MRTTAASLLGLVLAAGFAAAQPPKKDGKGLTFELYKDVGGEFRWKLKAANGEPLATAGQGYKAKADAKNGIDRIRKDADTDKLKFEVYADKNKDHRWRLKAANGQIIAASSEGYKNKADAEAAVDLVKKRAADAKVEDKSATGGS